MRSRALFVSVAVVLGTIPLGAAEFVPPTIVHPQSEDRDHNLLVDRLELKIEDFERRGNPSERIRIEVVLYEPHRESDLALFEGLGGEVIHVYRAVSYGFAGVIEAGRVHELKEALNDEGRLCVIVGDPRGGITLDYSVRQTRARPHVWNAGYTGNSSTTIAILDTGIDDSHTDFSGRVSSGWIDTTADNHATKVDFFGHGSHVAGIALGSGGSYGIGTPGMTVTTTQNGFLSGTNGTGWFDHVEVKNTGVNALALTLWWSGVGSTTISARDTAWNWMAFSNFSSSPATISFTIGTTGVYRPFFGNQAGAGNLAYAGNSAASYNPVGDGFNLFSGVAPGAILLGVKVLLDTGSGFGADWGAGLDWCVTNRDTYNIRVINLSLALFNGATNAILDQKVNNAVANGIVVVASAANDFPTNTIVAPGGSKVAGTRVTSVETNDGDAHNTQSDHTADNYAGLHGTSMAAPMVAGLAALVIDAQEANSDPWGSTLAEVLEVKNIILMTATETNQIGELAWNPAVIPPNTPSGNDPTLDRGAADLREGFGRINADAAVEAVTTEFDFTFSAAEVVGSNPTDRQAFAFWLNLDSSKFYRFEVLNPSGVDCDLFIYSGTPDGDGRPVIATSRTTVGDADEHIGVFQPATTGRYYAVVKRVTGSGSVGFGGGDITTTVIFADGFESGDTTLWSDTTP